MKTHALDEGYRRHFSPEQIAAIEAAIEDIKHGRTVRHDHGRTVRHDEMFASIRAKIGQADELRWTAEDLAAINEGLAQLGRGESFSQKEVEAHIDAVLGG